MNARNSVLKIVIAHENLVTGIEAATMLGRLVAQLEAEFGLKGDAWQIETAVWKFEMLRDPELWKQAATEAVEADIIIFAAGCAALPASVRNWIENVLSMKDGGPAALLALLHRSPETSGSPPRLEDYLRQLAEQCGLDFFCNINGHPPGANSGVEFTGFSSGGDSGIRRRFSPELSFERTGRQ